MAPVAAVASEWNKGGTTYEQRTFGDSVRSRIKELMRERRAALTVGPLPGVGRLVATGIAGWGDSSADIIVTRGKVKKIYDIAFKVVVQLVPEEESSSASSSSSSSAADLLLDADEADEKDDKDKGKEGKEGEEGKDKDKDGKPEEKEKDKEKKEAPKNPRVLLFFKDVSNSSEEERDGAGGRDVEVLWAATPAIPDGKRAVVTTAIGVKEKAGLTAELRKIVELAVEEFKAK